MIIFKDILSGDELFSDAKRVEKKLDECAGLWRVPVKKISVSNAIDDSLIGGNASAEGEDAGDSAADGNTTGIDIVIGHKLEPLGMIFTQDAGGKTVFKGYFKKLCKAIANKLEACGEGEKSAEWKKAAGPILKYVLKNWKNLDFYGGEHFDMESETGNSFCFLTYDDCSGLEDYMYFVEYSLLEEKV